jgi:lipopolysaccharide cholinephosphotransferase
LEKYDNYGKIKDMNIDEKKQLFPKIQSKELEMLQEIDRICSLLGIKYFLYYGTLLGAVRHKGFIPWDDDADIIMLRKDYDVFLKESDHFINSEKFYLDDCQKSSTCFLPFSKMRYKGTLLVEPSTKKNQHNEIWVDIFPFDNLPESLKERKKYSKNLQKYIKILNYRLASSDTSIKTFFKKTAGYLMSFKSTHRIKENFDCKMRMYDDLPSKFVGNAGYAEHAFSKALFSDPQKYIFEGIPLLGPINPSEILSILYGDYNSFPPENERYIGHNIIEVKL